MKPRIYRENEKEILFCLINLCEFDIDSLDELLIEAATLVDNKLKSICIAKINIS